MWGSSPEHQPLVDHWLDWEASALKVTGGGGGGGWSVPLVRLGGQRVECGGGGVGGPLVGLGGQRVEGEGGAGGRTTGWTGRPAS